LRENSLNLSFWRLSLPGWVESKVRDFWAERQKRRVAKLVPESRLWNFNVAASKN
jgi:hypothetical protein